MLSSAALLTQLIGPGVLRAWQERTRPGAQSIGHAELVLDNGTRTEMQYLVYLPTDYSSSKRFPLMLFLHGRGQSGNDLELVKKSGPPALIERGMKPTLIVVSPQCPPDRTWDSTLLLMLADFLERKYSVDADRIYVAGYSMGGYGTWDLITAAPTRFAAAVPVSGGAKNKDLSQLTNLPIWAFHGDEDQTVPIQESQRAIESIKTAEGTLARLTILEGQGHGISDLVFARNDLWEWLVQQRRINH